MSTSMRQKDWDVWLGKWKVDTVWMDADMEEDEIRRGLIEHDGYHPQIKVSAGAAQRALQDAEADDARRRQRNDRRFGF